MSRYGAVMASARERWNERRAGADLEPFPDAASEWLTEHLGLLPSEGRALDVACGDGRNALALARHGLEVDAVDVSDVTIAALLPAAPQRAPGVHPRVVDLEREPVDRGAYDVVVNFNYLQRDLFGALAGALRPGGWLVFETFGPAHLEQLGRRMNPDYVLGPNELLQAFGDLRVRHFFEGVAQRGGAPRGVAALVAQRL
jgi:SAM-dependent methyltransferase